MDAVELMNIGVNFRREHLRITQRTHYVIKNGGDQPNVVPPNASVWYYFRETDYPHIKALWETGDAIADGAALMTNLPGHNWANAVTMATPIAHKGATAGAKVAAMTLIDMLVKPEILKEAWTYFNEVQMKDVTYEHFITDDDKPAIWANQELMDRYREEMSNYYFDPNKFDTYLEQLGIEYPTVRPEQ